MFATSRRCIRRKLRTLVGRVLPASVRGALRSRFPMHPGGPAAGMVNWGSLRRTTPISPDFGFGRGTPVDRFYIEGFLRAHQRDIQGHVLEVQDSVYTRTFGGTRVSQSSVLDMDAANPKATIVADLGAAAGLEGLKFDCIVLTQTLQLIYDVPAAISNLHKSLKPGGILLATVPGITPVSFDDLGHTWYWSFTTASLRRLLEERFQTENVMVVPNGNVLSATAFLHGLSAEELTFRELSDQDPNFQVIVTARARKGREQASGSNRW